MIQQVVSMDSLPSLRGENDTFDVSIDELFLSASNIPLFARSILGIPPEDDMGSHDLN
jgi:hypothetical protein